MISPSCSKRKVCSSWGRVCCHSQPPRTILRLFFLKMRRKSWKKWRQKVDLQRTHQTWMRTSRCLHTGLIFRLTCFMSGFYDWNDSIQIFHMGFFSGATGCRKREGAKAAAHICSKRSSQAHWGNPCKSFGCKVLWLFRHSYDKTGVGQQFFSENNVTCHVVAVCPSRLTSLSCGPHPLSHCQTSS